MISVKPFQDEMDDARMLNEPSGFNWFDVTETFFQATDGLELGELCHDELFGLFEAMSAIEMMDPKMDAGMMCNRINKKVFNFDQAIKAGRLKVNSFQEDEKIGIIDDTFACFVTWLEGHSLAQTVFTNLYLHNSNSIEDKCIRAFCVLTLKLVDIVRDFVTKALVFEEEDFQPVVFGYSLASDISDSKACAMIRDAEEEIQRKMKSSQRAAKSLQTDDNNQKHFNTDLEQQREEQLSLALYTRLKFCRLFFQSLILFKREALNKNQLPKKISNATSGPFDEIDKHLQLCSETFNAWHKTLNLGIVPASSTNSEHRADYPTIMGFEPLVNQRLLPPTFPRYTKMKSRKEAIEYLDSLIRRLRHVCKVYENNSFHSALDFFDEFSKSSLPSCVLSRSILQSLYLPQPNLVFGTTHLSEILKEGTRYFIRPPSLQTRSPLLTTASQAKDYIDMFFNHCTRPMSGLLQISGHNRARQREKLAQSLEELVSLQDEAEKLDAFLNGLSQKLDLPFSHMGYYSTWLLYHILRVMIKYLLTGFELELYATHEYPYIFWYLYEFLFGWMVSTLNRASNLVIDQPNQNMDQQKGKNSKKSKPKKRKQKPHFREILINQGLQQLCGGYYKTVSAFKLEEKLKMPTSAINSEQIRFEHRFSPFLNVVAPPPVNYHQYKEMNDTTKYPLKPNELYLTACKCFHQAKTLFEDIPDPNEEISTLIKIAKTNFIVIKLLLSGHKGDSKMFPEFDFSGHKNFSIIRIL